MIQKGTRRETGPQGQLLLLPLHQFETAPVRRVFGSR